jgi:hypothetical protein
MSNPLFENSKVALGFGALVIAGGLTAALVFGDLSPGESASEPVATAAKAEPESPAVAGSGFSDPASGFADGGGDGGWADGGELSDDWGVAPGTVAVAPPNQDGAPGSGGDATDFGDFAPAGRSTGGGRPKDPAGVKTAAAPGAPEIRPPGGGPARGELRSIGN